MDTAILIVLVHIAMVRVVSLLCLQLYASDNNVVTCWPVDYHHHSCLILSLLYEDWGWGIIKKVDQTAVVVWSTKRVGLVHNFITSRQLLAQISSSRKGVQSKIWGSR